ncbi:MAG: bifunctional aldolase/short-chain dehydrogenase [Planctomycetes bacterium]|nr:bifunctional aldolase/short-chain dehydrogenase [Planctomycetota bacterium]
MQSRWNDATARDYVARYAAHGEALALRLYTCHLLGQDPSLVLHGGGNTSVKTTRTDLLGRDVPVLCVKGSGSDLAEVGPEGMPAVRLQPLLELRALDALGDQAMVDAVRGALLDSRAPNPSVETLLHAFLPHAYVDHTHADAILALTDTPDPAARVRAALGDAVVLLPWIMPGFPLAQAVAAAFAAAPQCRGIVLAKHGLFTFGDSARQSYERTIELVDRAEKYLAHSIGGRPSMLWAEAAPWSADERRALLARALPILRGAVARKVDSPVGPAWQRVVADARTADDLAAFAAHGAARQLCATGPITPDHVIRTKGHYLFLGREEAVAGDQVHAAVAAYCAAYQRYFTAHRPDPKVAMLPPEPRIAVVAGIGLVALGAVPSAARIAADIAEHTLRTKAMAHDLDRFEALPDHELARMEYWPLELAKLSAQKPPPLQGQIAFVTGAAGAIGSGIVEALLEAGACVFATDVDAARLATAMQRFAAHHDRLACGSVDLRDAEAVAAEFTRCVLRFGGVDIVVPNAGIAHVARLTELSPARFAEVQDVNVRGTLHVLQAAAPILRAQGTGGSVVVQASKNAFAPGAGFGAYSASKAAALQLARIAALEFAEFGVRVNAINADAVFGTDAQPSQLWQQVGPDRMRARGLDEQGLRQFYRDRSLLKTEVLPRHVGEAVVFFASCRTPTTGAVLPVDGGLPEAFPR